MSGRRSSPSHRSGSWRATVGGRPNLRTTTARPRSTHIQPSPWRRRPWRPGQSANHRRQSSSQWHSTTTTTTSSTRWSAIGIGRDSTRPREAAIVHAPAKRCRNDSAQATGRRTGIISSTHTANPSRVPSAMPFMMFYPFLLNHTSAWKTVPVYTRFDANSVLSKSTDQFDENHISSTMTCSAPPLAYHCISKSLILELLSCNTERAAGWNVF